jgi:hypothetical protein
MNSRQHDGMLRYLIICGMQENEGEVGSLYLGQIYNSRTTSSPFTVDQKLQVVYKQKTKYSFTFCN